MLTVLTKMTASLITALSILTEPVRETCLAGVTPQEALLSALQRNQLKLREQLSAVKELDEAQRLLEEARGEVVWFCADTEDFTWSFVQECLTLLYCLARHLSQLREVFTQSQGSASAKAHPPDAAPPLPPDVLSIAQQKTLSAVLQFLITLGLCPYLAPGVGVSLGLRSAFGTAVDGAVRREVLPPCERRLLTTTTVLLDVSAVSSLATLVFTRHLGDLMAALCQLGYRPHRSESGVAESSQGLTVEECKSCRQALQDLLGRVYQPIVIKELLVLQGGAKAGAGATRAPPWLRRLCGQLLSERLVQPQGVQAVVRAVLEGTRGGDSDWRKCDAIAKILATCPQQSSSAESYYSQVCPQVLELLHFKDKITAKQFQRVATRAALTIVQDQPEFAQSFLLSPLFSPLRCCAAVPEVSRVAGDDVSQHAVAELELTTCVEDVYKICVVGNSPSAMLLSTLGDVFPVIFTLFCFTKQNVSHLRGPCQEILLWYLSHTEVSLALSLLKGLCVKDGGGVTSGFQFTPGSEGGATLTRQQPISDEDDALYEKVSDEQWRVECVVQLLAELKDSDLPGELFLLLLHDLTAWEDEEEEQEEEVHVSTTPMMLLELEEQLKGRSQRRGQRLALLHTLAVMCEGLPHTLLLRKPSQVVGFVWVMFQRAAVGLEQGSDGSVDSQTLSLAMGLVAALLSGATELMAGDYSCMAELLTPLERLSQCHPDPVIQELACDLRACIATRGAFRPASRSSATYPRSHAPGPDGLRASQASPSQASPSQASPMPSPAASSSSAPQRGPEGAAPGHSPSRHAATTAPGKSPASRSRNGDGEDSGMMATGIGTCGPASSAEKTFSDWLLEVCDPDVPTRTMALRALTQAVREGHKEALESREKVLALFLENLEHEDSFVYLSAIQGLVGLADSFPEQILARLLVEYQASPSSASATSGPSLETRLKLGEALMRASRAMGDLAPHYGRPLIGAFLRGTRDKDSSVRASCLSNLGELCQLLHFSLGPLAQELSTCLTALIKTEREPEVRRAAVHVIVVLLRGLSDRAPEVLGDILLELYRAVKWVVQFDPDDVAVLQAQLALEELDGVMRRFIFPQQKLEKKIVVLP